MAIIVLQMFIFFLFRVSPSQIGVTTSPRMSGFQLIRPQSAELPSLKPHRS